MARQAQHPRSTHPRTIIAMKNTPPAIGEYPSMVHCITSDHESIVIAVKHVSSPARRQALGGVKQREGSALPGARYSNEFSRERDQPGQAAEQAALPGAEPKEGDIAALRAWLSPPVAWDIPTPSRSSSFSTKMMMRKMTSHRTQWPLETKDACGLRMDTMGQVGQRGSLTGGVVVEASKAESRADGLEDVRVLPGARDVLPLQGGGASI